MEYEVETSSVDIGIGGIAIEGDGYWVDSVNEQEIWATEEEYDQASHGYRQSDGGWNGGMDYRVGAFEGRQSRSGSEPPHKKSKNTHGDFQGNGSRGRGGYQGEFGQGTSSGTPPPSNGNGGEGGSSSAGGKSKGTGRMFFKTKLCCKFRAGICPYSSNCNFAHGMEELRKPPPNWQEIVAAQEEDRAQRADRRGENQIPCVSSSGAGGDSQRFHKTRHCKKFYTDEGCPYGDRCNFVHDDQSRSRESVAISLGPTTSGGSGNGAGNGKDANGSFQRPLNWKTRICNKWETTGHCPFGDKCHFAHGLEELQKYGGGIPDIDNIDTSAGPRNDSKQTGTLTKAHVDAGSGQAPSVYNTDNYVIGNSNPRSIGSFLGQRQSQRILPKWKGPDKISKIYGDWIEDNEWEYVTRPTASQIEKASQADDKILHEV